MLSRVEHENIFITLGPGRLVVSVSDGEFMGLNPIGTDVSLDKMHEDNL